MAPQIALSLRSGRARRVRGQRISVNGSWIAATAIALQVPVVTQDDDFPHVEDLGIIRV